MTAENEQPGSIDPNQTTSSQTGHQSEDPEPGLGVPGNAPPEKEPVVDVAVIGDVTTDWAFVSREPAPSRIPEPRPWTRDIATHLYAIPGGAWLFGHMLQGALVDPPVFERVHSVTIDHAQANITTIVNLNGEIDLPSKDAPLAITLQTSSPKAFRLLFDHDPTDFPIDQPITVHLSRPDDSSHKTKIQIGIRDISLDIAREHSSTPGYLFANQISRVYDAENVVITNGTIQCTMLEIRHCTFQVMKPQTLTRFGTVSFLPNKDGNDSTACLNVTISTTPPSLAVTHATLDVTYGTLTAHTTLTDRGKLNGAFPEPVAGTTGTNTSPNVALRCMYPRRSPDVRLFFYDNPRETLTRPDRSHVVYTLSELKPYNRYEGQKGPLQVYRRAEHHGIAGPAFGYPLVLDNYYPVSKNALKPNHHQVVFEPKDQTAKPEFRSLENLWTPGGTAHKLIVIDDEGLGFGRRSDLWHPFLPFLQCCKDDAAPTDEALALMKNQMARAKQDLARTWVVIKASQWLDCHASGLLKYLKECDVLDRTVVVISGESLRKGLTGKNEKPGIKLSKTVSWERTVEDFAHAWSSHLGQLPACGHVLVRLGMEGAIYASNRTGVDRHILLFDPQRIEGEYAPLGQFGECPGLSTVFTCAVATRLVEVLANFPAAPVNVLHEIVGREIEGSLAFALTCIRRYFDLGYGPGHETIEKYANLMLPVSQVFKTGRITHLANDGLHKFRPIDVSPAVRAEARSLSPETSWSLLSQALQPVNSLRPARGDDRAEVSRQARINRAIQATQLGRRIVLRGVERGFHGTQWVFPYARFGRLVSVDRTEIEGLRSIRNLLSEYINNRDRKEPVSVAVFGPPGSGKSFGVTEIADRLAGSSIQKFVFNMGQFASFSDVTRLLLEVRDVSLRNKMPLVFFDEFDSQFDGRPLGWLKYFLAPMQDGRFQHENTLLNIGRAIFVFAGGIAADHESFRKGDIWDTPGKHENAYLVAKGPDFHSRLRGFLNVTGLNPRLRPPLSRDAPRQEVLHFDRYDREDFEFVVRRAILIRQMIEKYGTVGGGGILDVEGNAEIDRDLLDALLLCDEYLHGVRSMMAIFEMSAIYKERALIKTALPSHEQLQMHVDETFYSILRRQYVEVQSKILEDVLNATERSARGRRKNN